eukprot:5850146-Prorocentrum_lima.AAC.1
MEWRWVERGLTAGRGQWVLSVEEGGVRAGQRLGHAEADGRGVQECVCRHMTSGVLTPFLS